MPFGYRKKPVKAVISEPTRALATEYQNTTGRPLLIIVCTAHSRAAADEKALMYARCANHTPLIAADKISSVGLFGTGPITTEYFQITFLVPNQYYYSLVVDTTGSAIVAKDQWFEVEL